MSTEFFEKDNWSWQISQFVKQTDEWIEFQLDRLNEYLPDWTPGKSVDGEVLRNWLSNISWALLFLLLAWFCWLLWRSLSPYFYSWWAGFDFNLSLRKKATQTELSSAALFARSQEMYRQGNFRDACRILYLALLQNLHEKGILPHKLSRTDGEYLQLLQISVTPMQPYETLITTHERLCFDEMSVSSENYEQCQQAYMSIDMRTNEDGGRKQL